MVWIVYDIPWRENLSVVDSRWGRSVKVQLTYWKFLNRPQCVVLEKRTSFFHNPLVSNKVRGRLLSKRKIISTKRAWKVENKEGHCFRLSREDGWNYVFSYWTSLSPAIWVIWHFASSVCRCRKEQSTYFLWS